MFIKKVHIKNFRNILDFEFNPSRGLNGFWGPNGQGKTNLLEAIYVTLKGESFRPYTHSQDWVPNRPEGPLECFISLEDERGFPMDVLYRIQENKKELYFNGKKTLAKKISLKIPVVVFSPEDHVLLRGAPEQRRGYLDLIYSDICPGYLELLHRFDKTLKNRNRILKQQKEREHYDYSELETWTELFVDASLELSSLRQELFVSFQELYLAVLQLLNSSLSEKTALRIEKKIEMDFSPEKKQTEKERLLKLYRDKFIEDLNIGWTRLGPHRDDLLFLIDGKNARTQASQGQARLLALALKWAHTEWVKRSRSENPLFIIDDFSSELDAERREVLMQQIKLFSGQVFTSGTDPSVIDEKCFVESAHFYVKHGTLTAHEIGANLDVRKRERTL